MATSILNNNPRDVFGINVYCSLGQANQHFMDRLNSEVWDNATDDIKNKALLFATRVLDATYTWKGSPVEFEQNRDWPRYNVYDEDGYYINYDVIPRYLIEATAELALKLLEQDRISNEEPSTIGIKKVKLGSLAVDFENAESIKQLKIVPDYIDDIVAPLVRFNRDANSVIVDLRRS